MENEGWGMISGKEKSKSGYLRWWDAWRDWRVRPLMDEGRRSTE